MSSPHPPTRSYRMEPAVHPLPTPPLSVQAACAGYLFTALLSMIGIVVALSSDAYNKAIVEAGNGAGARLTPDQLVSVMRTVVLVVGGLLIALYVFLALKMRAGRNWARLTLTLMSVLAIANVGASGSLRVNTKIYSSTMSVISGWVGAAVAVSALVFMFVSTSNAYFRDATASRESRSASR